LQLELEKIGIKIDNYISVFKVATLCFDQLSRNGGPLAWSDSTKEFYKIMEA